MRNDMRRFATFVAGGLVLAALVGWGSWQLSQPKSHMQDESSTVQAGYATTSTAVSTFTSAPASPEPEPERGTTDAPVSTGSNDNGVPQANGAHDLYLPPGTPDVMQSHRAHPTRWAPAPPAPQRPHPNFPQRPIPHPPHKPAPFDDDDDPWVPLPRPDFPDEPETTPTSTEAMPEPPTVSPTVTMEPTAPLEPTDAPGPDQPVEPAPARSPHTAAKPLEHGTEGHTADEHTTGYTGTPDEVKPEVAKPAAVAN